MKQARKLLREKEEKALAEKLKKIEDEEDSYVDNRRNNSSFNAFSYLEEEENVDEMYGEDVLDMIDQQEKSSQNDEEEITSYVNTAKPNNKKNKKKKKNAKKKEDTLTDEEFLQQQIQQMGLDEGGSATEGSATTSSASHNVYDLFEISDVKSLNPENEFKRIFGSEAISQTNAAVSANYEESLPRVLRNNPHYVGKRSVVIGKKKNETILNLFVSAKPHWPHYRTLYMTTQLKSTKPNNVEVYEVVEQKTVTGGTTGLYAQIQEQYERALQSGDPNSFIYILQQVHPYHVHTLLQMSEVFRTMQGENDQAQDLNERALFAIQHILNNQQFVNGLVKGTSRLDSSQEMSKAIYLSILSRLHALARSGAHNTAFDLSRVLLSLSCDSSNPSLNIADPTHVLLFIDYYAIRIRKFRFVYHDLVENFILKHQEELQYLPNLMYNRALSLWQDNHLSEANDILQRALKIWPMVVVGLLTETKTSRFSEFESRMRNTFFTNKICSSPIFSKLISAYVRRNVEFWKNDDVLDWLKYNIEEILDNGGSSDDDLRQSCYSHPVFSTNYSVIYEKEVLGEVLPDLNQNNNQPTRSNAGRNPFLYFLESLMPWSGGGVNLNQFFGAGNDDEEDDIE
ncbi:predicted protein [Naegleria gruberi]|uniref:Predicted protein n=1 Tax=Naegleria gruberi TaxID=5762 RepID=D2VCR1_NAEGR|nr:uncharacterized protein NAEGRDRAFT_48487 [Naegleria gruberi]EFC45352.1 predicted protein [Naegleria gruberi]|eukprot:XP_002678096.1 predicted protein [Naegleria gruberi strain NEG-M]